MTPKYIPQLPILVKKSCHTWINSTINNSCHPAINHIQVFIYLHQSVIWNKPDYVYDKWATSLRAQMIKIKFPSLNMPLVGVEQIPNKRLQPFQIWWMDSFAVCPEHGQKPSINIHSTISNLQSQSPRVTPKYSGFSLKCSPYLKTNWHATNYFSSCHENKFWIVVDMWNLPTNKNWHFFTTQIYISIYIGLALNDLIFLYFHHICQKILKN